LICDFIISVLGRTDSGNENYYCTSDMNVCPLLVSWGKKNKSLLWTKLPHQNSTFLPRYIKKNVIMRIIPYWFGNTRNTWNSINLI